MFIAIIIILCILFWLFLSAMVYEIVPKITPNMDIYDREPLQTIGAIFSPIGTIVILIYIFIMVCRKNSVEFVSKISDYIRSIK